MNKRMQYLWALLLVVAILMETLFNNQIMSEAMTDYNLKNPQVINGISTWDCIYFGEYWQNDTNGNGVATSWDGDEKEPVKWRVLQVNGDDAFLLADMAIEWNYFHNNTDTVTWETSDIRQWLQNVFMNNCFDAVEQDAIKVTDVANEDCVNGSWWYDKVYDLPNTLDKIYLLSASESRNEEFGFSDSNLETVKVKNTQYTQDSGAYTDDNGFGFWWLRSQGVGSCYSGIVTQAGGLFLSKNDYGRAVLRPCLHLDLSNTSVWSYAGTVSSDGSKSEDVSNTPSPSMGSGSTSVPVATQTAIPTITKNPNIDNDFKIGNKVSFRVPEDVPLIGGGEVGLDFDNIPVQFEQDGNTFRLGIGCDDVSDSEWTTFKKFVETQKEDYRKGCTSMLKYKHVGEASMGWSAKPSISCYGYAEGIIENGQIASIGGKMVLGMKLKVSNEWQYMVVVVPVVLKVKGTVGIETSYEVGVDFTKKEVYMDGDIELTLPKITISGGVGVMHIADVSAYGTADNKLKITKSGRVTGKLIGEVGVSAKLLFASYKKKLLKGTWNYYDSAQKGTLSENPLELEKITEESFSILRTKDIVNTEFVSVNPLTGEGAEEDSESSLITLTENGYQDMQPKTITLSNDRILMIYIANRKERTTGNHTAVCYRIYDSLTSEWSEENIIQDDGTADFFPEIASDGHNTYVVWTDTCRSDIEEDTGLEEISKSCEIKVSRFDEETMSFMEIEVLTDNDYYDTTPSIVVKEGIPYVSWVGYVGDDLLNMSGISTIQMASKEGNWKTTLLSTVNKPLRDIQIGQFKDINVVYSLDEDGDLNSIEDSELYLVEQDNSIQKLTENESYEENPQFVNLTGEQKLAWYVDGEGLYERENDGMQICLLADDGILSSDYKVIGDDEGGILLCPSREEEGSNLYGYMLKEGQDSLPISLTNMGGYVRDLYGCCMTDSYGVSFVRTDAIVTDTDLEESFDLCFLRFSEYTDLKLEKVDYLEENIFPGKVFEATVAISNQGMQEITEMTVTVLCDGREIVSRKVNQEIAVGESSEIQIQIPLPTNFSTESKLEFSIATDGEELDNTNDSQSVQVGKTDLEMKIEESCEGDGNKFVAAVTNISGFDTIATLNVHSKDANGTILMECPLGLIKAGTTLRREFSEEEILMFASNGDSLYFEVKSDSQEQFYSNNFAFASCAGVDETLVPIGTMSPGFEIVIPSTQETFGPAPLVTTPPDASVSAPSKVSKVKAKSTKKKTATISWEKVANASGYQIQYALNKKFTKKAKKKLLNKTKVTLKKLKRKKTYYVRVRAYRLDGTKKVYGKWSKRVKVRVK